MTNEKRILDIVAAIGTTEDIFEIRKIVLDMIRKIVWFDTANFWLYPPLITHPQQALVFMDSPQNSLNNYLQHYVHLDEFHQKYNLNNLLIARSTDLLDYSKWTKQSEYYYDFLKENNVYYILGFDIKDDYMSYGALCLHREKSIGNFLEKELLILHTLYPHLVNKLRWVYEKKTLRSKLYNLPDTELEIDYFNLLTVREREIVQQVLFNKSNPEIAINLGISINTVKMHLQNIFIKLGIKKRGQLFSLYSVKKSESC
ncbi:MAG: hypothetical protein CVU84_16390 [Firmicutes bacterium HGW-Firmicutes-1]|jgi:DNA-binding CsgD family transcriptional regulator|nr:MAG: hypothetical protein CVU84_16390 [Firmicutes bacterium HGW-Firmicutes-1]